MALVVLACARRKKPRLDRSRKERLYLPQRRGFRFIHVDHHACGDRSRYPASDPFRLGNPCPSSDAYHVGKDWGFPALVQCGSINIYVNVSYRCVMEASSVVLGVSLTRKRNAALLTMPHTYTISDLAKEFDLTTRAIRFYEDMGLLQPERNGPAGRSRVYSGRDRTRLRLTLRAKRLGLSLSEAKEIIDLYDSPRDTGVQLRKFLDVLVVHRRQLEEQMADLQANLEEVQEHEKEARALLLQMENKNS
jgi:Predicted transcriptional regulators